MGRIKQVLKKKKILKPKLNKRFTVELCENVHIHYRNLRIEFTKEEFMHILKLLKGIDDNKVKNFKHSDYAYEELVHDLNLPNETYYNNRLQIEEQIEGHHHIHYRNLRIELDSLEEFGYGKNYKNYKKLSLKIKTWWKEFKLSLIKRIYKPKSAEIVSKEKNISIDNIWYDNNIKPNKIYKYKVKNIKLKDIRCVLFVKEGTHLYKLQESPAYKFLQGDKQAYTDYCNFKNPRGGGDIHSEERFEKIIKELEEYGYNPSRSIIVIDENNRIMDGMHRAAYLLHKFGKNHKVKILKLWKVR